MTLDEFQQSLTVSQPLAGLSLALAGLWWDAKGDWTRAHESAQQDEGVEGSWVHVYLHRKEGDQGNAAYWYNSDPCGFTFHSLGLVRWRIGTGRPPQLGFAFFESVESNVWIVADRLRATSVSEVVFALRVMSKTVAFCVGSVERLQATT